MILKENTANYVIGKVNKCGFRKKMRIAGFLNSANENCKNDGENDHASFSHVNEVIGYQSSADFCEIQCEHSFDVVKRKLVGDDDLQCNAHCLFFAAQT